MCVRASLWLRLAISFALFTPRFVFPHLALFTSLLTFNLAPNARTTSFNGLLHQGQDTGLASPCKKSRTTHHEFTFLISDGA